ncbi:sensor histidine kinase [Deinococcus sp. UYEF24]
MRLLPRLFLSHAAVVLLTVLALLAVAELLAPAFIQHHVNEMVAMIGPSGRSLSADLSRGMHNTLNSALLLAASISLVVAFVTAFLASQRVVGAVRQLSAGSRSIAEGQYHRRLPVTGQDEFADLARNFNRMAAVLAQVEASRVELISNVAHELRTPLTALQGYGEALNDGVMPPPHAAAAIVRETRAMERLTNDLSLVSRVEAGQIELHLQTVNVRSLLEAAQERFGVLAESRGIDLRVTLPEAEVTVHADAERAAQVLANLISNALKYSPSGSAVTLGAGVLAEQVTFQVSDTGEGLNAEQLARIFERFYRVDSARSRLSGGGGTGGGSGVGLTIARGLARAMGGDIGVVSAPGDGSTFSFSLPVGPGKS